jgi:predicted O-methyltransferase YrrM
MSSPEPGTAGPYRVLEFATTLAFGALNAPFLLASLYGGSRDARRALVERLGLPPDALPGLGGWRADVGLLRLLTDHIERAKPQTVVEFGSGASTVVIARALERFVGPAASFISFEHDEEFSRRTRERLSEHRLGADLRVAPLVPAPGGWPGRWYDHGPLPANIDLLVIDGPPWTTHPFTRGAADTLFSRIPTGGVVLLDDGARPGERVVAARWRRKWPGFSFELVRSGSKGTLVGTRR